MSIRPSIATVNAAAQSAEAAARALAGKLRKQNDALLPEIEPLIESVFKVAAFHAVHIERGVSDELTRARRQAIMQAVEERVERLLSSAAELASMPFDARAEFVRAEIIEALTRAASEAQAEFDYHIAERCRSAWEWAIEQFADLVSDSPPRSNHLKSRGPRSSLAAMQKLRSIRDCLDQQATDHAANLVIAAIIPVDPAIWLREMISKYEREAPSGKSFDEVTGLGVGRRWHTVERQDRNHALIRMMDAGALGLDTQLEQMRSQNAVPRKYSPRHCRRIVSAK